ncbi:hypothetical protein ACLB2K_036438 [Fragaria x ananassa]
MEEKSEGKRKLEAVFGKVALVSKMEVPTAHKGCRNPKQRQPQLSVKIGKREGRVSFGVYPFCYIGWEKGFGFCSSMLLGVDKGKKEERLRKRVIE